MTKQKIAIGSDHGGYELKTYIERFLAKSGYDYKDFGCFDTKPLDYPLIAKEVAKAVATGSFTKGIIVCGSGLGVCIAANKVSGIRAVNCTDAYCAKMSRMHNDANVLTLGGRIVGTDLALDIIDIWLKTNFEGGRHQRRIDMLEK